MEVDINVDAPEVRPRPWSSSTLTKCRLKPPHRTSIKKMLRTINQKIGRLRASRTVSPSNSCSSLVSLPGACNSFCALSKPHPPALLNGAARRSVALRQRVQQIRLQRLRRTWYAVPCLPFQFLDHPGLFQGGRRQACRRQDAVRIFRGSVKVPD